MKTKLGISYLAGLTDYLEQLSFSQSNTTQFKPQRKNCKHGHALWRTWEQYRAKILPQFTKNNFGLLAFLQIIILTTSDLSNLYCKTYESTRSAQFLSVFIIVANSNPQQVNTSSCGLSRLVTFLLREQVHVTIQAHILWRHMCRHQQLCFPDKAATLQKDVELSSENQGNYY